MLASEEGLPPEVLRYRQDYLEALPIAAAVIGLQDGKPGIIAANDKLNLVAGPDLPRRYMAQMSGRLRAFLLSDEEHLEYQWQEPGIGNRHFTVRFSRLSPAVNHARRCLLSLVDRTAQVETERSLRAEMLHDSLTGLPNRLAFNEAVEAAIEADAGGQDSFAVLVVDLTRFSRINECMGSMAGDELIITVARRLMATLRAGDVLARLGGDEFGILLRLADGPGDALQAARRIASTFATPIRLSELEICVDCAVGCALMNGRAAQAGDIIRNAQFAMKRAKQSGRVEVYQPGEVSAARRRFSLETELRRAIDRDELSLAFQPLINLETNSVSGFEALARWIHPDHGPIPPSEFIPVAEESGLIVPLGRWALDATARTLAEWDRRTGRVLPVYAGVNVSAVQLQRDDVAAGVAGALGANGLDGSRLTLELTESAIISDPDRAGRVLTALKMLDARIAMDDFGTGYSNLAYLQKLPIDILKIDRSFVTGMLADRDSIAIVRAVLSLADALGMKTTAEGIETVELARTLAALGCSTGQGYYFAKPLSADDALDYLLARAA
ncbi:GGDEF-domain containing protein [Sphingomonas oleivorans]|uniref:GGDEF-domain containing protein n=2 Tax=Sphingomonas oleivorans TaxID=1735121 RepID=A0A2T5G363_9SPHN|nr:EAL domain-containing protein [Sphingomonas oleivorans]PTQ13551.1 GGDEF-domain containing protein [Sphingomonas oleivorans]